MSIDRGGRIGEYKYGSRISHYTNTPENRYSKTASKSGSEVQSTLSEVEENFRKARKARLPFEFVWLRNIHFFIGHQYLSWSQTTRNLFVPPSPPWRVRMVINKVKPIVEYHVANLTKNRPALFVAPMTNDEGDIEKSKLAEKFLLAMWDNLDMYSKNIQLAYRMVIYGTAFLQPYWDVSKGDYINENDPNDGKLGDINVDCYSPMDSYPDPSGTSHDNIRYFIRARVLHVDTVRDLYPDEANKIEPEVIPFGEMFHYRVQSLLGPEGFNRLTETAPDLVLLKEYMEKPSRKHKEGRYIVTTSNVVLKNLTLKDVLGPHNFEELPQIKFDDIYIPDRYYGESTVSQLIAPQEALNRTISQAIEVKNLMCKPKWLVPKGHGIDENQFTSEPGEIIEYEEGKRPEIVDPPMLNPAFVTIIEVINNDLEEISGVFEIQKGTTPPGIKAASAVALIQEQGQTRHIPRSVLFEQNQVKLGMKLLKMAKDFYLEERLIRLVGENNSIEAFYFLGEDLNSFDVRVQHSSSFPTLKTAQEEKILTLMQYGLLQNQSPQKILEKLSLGDLYEANDLDQLNYSRAKKENILMSQGIPVLPAFHENHMIHEQEHIRYMTSEEFYRKPEFIKNIFYRHIIQTRQMAASPNPLFHNVQPNNPLMPEEGTGRSQETVNAKSRAAQGFKSDRLYDMMTSGF